MILTLKSLPQISDYSLVNQIFKEKMEKSVQSVVEQLLYLKKSLRKKRNSQVWQQCFQFYHNHQSNISSYHILKLIKIIFKPLKSNIIRNCKHFNSLVQHFQKIRSFGQNQAKFPYNFQKKIKDQVQLIKNKIKIIQNLFDSYTVALQKFLTASDPGYFKMLFGKNYERKSSERNLLLQSCISQSIQKPYSKQILQYQLSSYLKFVCQLTVLYCTCIFCYENECRIVKDFNIASKGLDRIFQTSKKFQNKKLKFSILKLNYLLKFEGNILRKEQNFEMDYIFGNILEIALPLKQNNCVNYLRPIKVEYEFPLQVINQLYKNHKKEQKSKLQNNYKLLLKYLFCIIRNLNNPNLRCLSDRKIGSGPQQLKIVTKIDRNDQMQVQVYILMKQITKLSQYMNFHVDIDSNLKLLALARNSTRISSNFANINPSLFNMNYNGAQLDNLRPKQQNNEFSKNARQFMSAVIDQYETAVNQQKKLCDFLNKIFDYKQLIKLYNDGYPSSSGAANIKQQKQSKKQNPQHSNYYRKQEYNKISKQKTSYPLKGTKLRLQTKISINCQNQKQSQLRIGISPKDQNHERIKIKILSSLENQVSSFYNQISNVYNFIDESESDDQNQMTHQFQALRRNEIAQLQSQINYRNKEIRNRAPQNRQSNQINPNSQKNTINFLKGINMNRQKEVTLKNSHYLQNELKALQQKTERFRSNSATILEGLKIKRLKMGQQGKMDGVDKIKQNIERSSAELERQIKFQLQFQHSYGLLLVQKTQNKRKLSLNTNTNTNSNRNKGIYPSSLNFKHHGNNNRADDPQRDKIDKRNSQQILKQQLLLPMIVKKTKQGDQKIKTKHHQSIQLSDSYDKMSRMILLANTNKQKNVHI